MIYLDKFSALQLMSSCMMSKIKHELENEGLPCGMHRAILVRRG